MVAKTLNAWTYEHAVVLTLWRRGEQVDSRHVERVHDTVRDECLNVLWFLNLAEASDVIEAWRVEYSTEPAAFERGGPIPA
jgi:putative transposase